MSKIITIMMFFFVMIIHSVTAISNVQHSIDGNKVTLTYQGTPPFLINIREDANIGQSGGYLWAKTYSSTFVYDMSFAINPSKKFYYGVKDTSWSTTNFFTFLREKSLTDRPDDISGAQVHVLYALPRDGIDESLDTNGKIVTSVAAFQKWFASQSGGRRLRMDTYRGSLDITFFRLSRADATMRSYGAHLRDQIESELKDAGFDSANKIYAVYYGGSSSYACGGAAWPPTLPGTVAVQYLKGEPPGVIPCATNTFTSSEDDPGYWEFAMLHEILHTMGIVAECAPNHTLAGHVSDDSRDLMYAGPLAWQPSILDLNNDDYFNHDNANCIDLTMSDYLI